jgi:hypothetical protein
VEKSWSDATIKVNFNLTSRIRSICLDSPAEAVSLIPKISYAELHEIELYKKDPSSFRSIYYVVRRQ